MRNTSLMPEKDNKQFDRKILRRVIRLFRPHKVIIRWTGLVISVAVLIGLLPPFFLQQIIDVGLQQKQLDVIARFSLLTVLAVFVGASLTLLYGYWGCVIGQRVMCDLRRSLFTHLQSMSLRVCTSTPTGDIQTRLINDVQGVQTVVSNTLTDQLSNAGIAVSTFAAMLIVDWRLTILSVGIMPFLSVNRRVRQQQGRMVLCNLSDFVHQVFTTTRLLINPGSQSSPFEWAKTREQAIDMLRR